METEVKYEWALLSVTGLKVGQEWPADDFINSPLSPKRLGILIRIFSANEPLGNLQSGVYFRIDLKVETPIVSFQRRVSPQNQPNQNGKGLIKSKAPLYIAACHCEATSDKEQTSHPAKSS